MPGLGVVKHRRFSAACQFACEQVSGPGLGGFGSRAHSAGNVRSRAIDHCIRRWYSKRMQIKAGTVKMSKCETSQGAVELAESLQRRIDCKHDKWQPISSWSDDRGLYGAAHCAGCGRSGSWRSTRPANGGRRIVTLQLGELDRSAAPLGEVEP